MPPKAAPLPFPRVRPRHPRRDIIEALLSALVMVLIIRHFVFEVFKIPTGSMAPTLLGQHRDLKCPNCGLEFPVDAGTAEPPYVRPVRAVCPNCGYEFPVDDVLTTYCRCFPSWPASLFRWGDNRVIVDKFFTRLRAPKRWDVIVFRSPIEPKTLIKRVVGLPGEKIQIRHGDIYVNGIIAPMPEDAQQALWRLVCDSSHVPLAPVEGVPPAWNVLRGTLAQKQGGVISVAPPENGPAEITYGREIVDTSVYSGRRGSYAVGELKWDANVSFADRGILKLKINEDYAQYVAAVPFGDGAGQLTEVRVSSAGTDAPDTPANISSYSKRFAAALNKQHRVEFLNCEQHFELFVDGNLLLSGPRVVPATANGYMSSAAIQVESSEAVFNRLRLYRKNCYISGSDPSLGWLPPERELQDSSLVDTYILPPNCYFMLGDNSRSSADARYWASTMVPSAPRYLSGKDIIGRAVVAWWPPCILHAIK